MRLGNAHFFQPTKLNKMEKQEMIKIILAYAKELDDNFIENRHAFGILDDHTKRAFSKWFVIDELIERLNLKK